MSEDDLQPFRTACIRVTTEGEELHKHLDSFLDAVSRVHVELMEILSDARSQAEELSGAVEKAKELEARLSEFDKYVLEKRLLPLECRVADLEQGGKRE